MKFNKPLLNNLLAYFLRGLLLVVPFALTGYIISLALNWIDRIIKLNIPGLGIAILLVTITFFGYLGSNLLVKSLLDLVESLVNRIPLISTLYTWLKEFTAAFVGNKKKFDQPVLVVVNQQEEIRRLGFVTQHTLDGLHLPGSVAVYLPHSYNFSGNLYLIPRQAVTPLAISSTEVLKFILSGGVTGLQDLEEA
ncbi:MAG: DUF502 domain-containing protein [Bacteroidota bacterium]